MNNILETDVYKRQRTILSVWTPGEFTHEPPLVWNILYDVKTRINAFCLLDTTEI